MALAGKRRSTKRKTPAQIAAAKKNLEKARAARSRKAGHQAGSPAAVAAPRKIALISSRGIIGTHVSGTSGNQLNSTGVKAVASQAKPKKKASAGKKVKKALTGSQIDASLAKKYGIPRSRVKHGIVMDEFGNALG